MPADAWLLLLVSVGLGLGLELAYMRARLKDRAQGRSGDRPDRGHPDELRDRRRGSPGDGGRAR